MDTHPAITRSYEAHRGNMLKVTTHVYGNGRARVAVSKQFPTRPGTWTFLREGSGDSVAEAREKASLT